MSVIDEMLEKFKRYEKRKINISHYLNNFFSSYKKDLGKISTKEIKAGNFKYRVDKFSKHFKTISFNREKAGTITKHARSRCLRSKRNPKITKEKK